MNASETPATALIAEDEPLLAANLKAELQALWPGLQVVASVAHGEAAVQQALALRPQLLFLDIRMPGMSGLEAAQAIAEDWPDDGSPLPALVFVTAYDEYALQAFEQAAVDYVLKPVQPARLAQTCARVQAVLKQRASAGGGAIDAALGQLRLLLGSGAPAAPAPAVAPLTVIQAAVGSAIHLVPVAEVVYFEAADKYVRVVTLEREYLVRISLRELLPQIDLQRFWQVHRGTVVRSDAIATALRDEAGKVTLTLRGHADRLAVSRLYANLFKPM
ncbi:MULTISPECIES: LytTR family DNA-binding domain-containing protein [unclassified Rhizobacter]|uniref:LytR/AlgR family response regulator transcription factor n=1 Tax=unclassified Rhizobacter TaxID=2640088 RepID=UPI0006FDFEDD|nr:MULTISPECIES: LytTR family DNA-binding domain-containing protein [unclassified Rhizobacter]KQU80573.1 LytR family transcriptional regulator [Rhizobacter sp. Root29]KQW09744.1 LytR family transcriptional regulator [Rhizobacter sp. Root1238]KRB14772.1 LytR family transcriptional regulator [Rhizobacter sp. Root16D2]